MLRLFAWNSFGNKWDTFWTNWIGPAVGTGSIAGVLTEAGWPPWMSNGNVQINNRYLFDSGQQWFNQASLATSAFSMGMVNAPRGKWATWVPWVRTLAEMNQDTKTNSRCSLGGTFIPDRSAVMKLQVIDIDSFKTAYSIRPAIKISLGYGDDVKFVVLVVHLISGKPKQAEEELEELMKKIHTVIPQTSSAIIVGDMNIDLLTQNVGVYKHFSIINTGVPTQQSGGELDWGLLYDPYNHYKSTTVNVVQTFKTGANTSDHSILRYDIPL